MNEQDSARAKLCDLKDKLGVPLTEAARRIKTIRYFRLNRFLKGKLDLMPEELTKISKLYTLELENAYRRDKEL